MQHFPSSFFVVTVAALVNLVSSGCIDQYHDTQHFEVECSEYSTNLRIVCHSDEWTNFLVNLQPRSALDVNFDNCSFPETKSVRSILQSLNVAVDKEIQFTNFPSTLNRQHFRGLSVPKLKFIQGDFSKLRSDLLYDVSDLKELSIVDTDLTRIPEAFFADWARNVQSISLAKSKLQKITRGDFVRLPNLKILSLWWNEIAEIEPGAFDSLQSLDEIRLNGNRLHTLPYGVFYYLSKLTDIDLSKNLFDELPQDLLRTVKNLTTFSMSGNRGNLKTLSNGFFKDLTHLKEVHLEDNRLEGLSSDIFSGCSSLENIYLNINQLRFLPVYIFRDLHQLKKLRISDNRLTSLELGVLKGLESVEDFDASYNNLTRIDSVYITYYLKSATVINLSHNQLTLESSDKSESSLSRNDSDGAVNLDPSIKLKDVILSYNHIAQLNNEVVNIMQYSKSIDLRYNRISKINTWELSTGLAVRNSLRNPNEYLTVYLSDNPLHCDCDFVDFARYVDAERFDLSRNILKFARFACAWPPEYQNRDARKIPPEEFYRRLESSDPEDACSGTCVCREYCSRHQVLSVDCSYRNLTQIPPNVKSANNWPIELNMSGNWLVQAPVLGNSNLTSVTSLDLSNNNISEVTRHLFSPSLQYLKLDGNRLTDLDSDVMEYLSRNGTFRNITLRDNEWSCGCGSGKFRDFLRDTIDRYSLQDVVCHGTQLKVYEASMLELCSYVIATVVIVSLSILCCVIVPVILHRKLKQQRARSL